MNELKTACDVAVQLARGRCSLCNLPDPATGESVTLEVRYHTCYRDIAVAGNVAKAATAALARAIGENEGRGADGYDNFELADIWAKIDERLLKEKDAT